VADIKLEEVNGTSSLLLLQMTHIIKEILSYMDKNTYNSRPKGICKPFWPKNNVFDTYPEFQLFFPKTSEMPGDRMLSADLHSGIGSSNSAVLDRA